MKTRLAVAAALAACLFHVLPAMADEAATIAEIRAAVVEVDQAYADEDLATIERLTTSDHVSIAPRYGGAALKEGQLATFEALERRNFDYSPIEVELLAPDIALVGFEKSYEGTFQGVPLPPRVIVSEVWLRRDGTWRQRLYQETPIETK